MKITPTSKFIISFFIVLALVFGTIILRARTNRHWFVNKTRGSDINDCLSPASACETINGALEKASSGNTVYVTAETYTGRGTDAVQITKSITLSGGWNHDFSAQIGLSTIDGEKSRRVIRIYFFGGSTIERFIIENGFADGGSGIFAESSLEMYECIVRNNSVGGDWIGQGGGIWIGPTKLFIKDSLIYSNTSNSGAGIFIEGGSAVVQNSTISGNVAKTQGGGIWNQGGLLRTNNVTITNNITKNGGGGIHNSAGGRVILENSIVAGNISGWANDCGGTIDTSGYNLIGETTNCTFTPTLGDRVNIDPKIHPIADNDGLIQTHGLMEDSPAIDSGNDQSCEIEDQRGVSRPQGPHCDLGAFEYIK